MTDAPLLVVSDVHLPPGGGARAAVALASLCRAHPGHELVLAGDTVTLSLQRGGRAPGELVATTLAAEPALADALRAHLAQGSAVTVVAGNHDAALVEPGAREPILAGLGLGATAPLALWPWCVRRGAVHIEHGHLYDPDNAPAHPLVVPGPRTEPLGVAITRRFVAPQRALAFAHEHETTPARGIVAVLERHRTRAPAVVAAYFAYGAAQCWRAGERGALARERHLGAHRLAAHAERADVPVEVLAALIAMAPRTTHSDTVATFRRLYLDRATATALIAAGVVGALLGLPAAAPVATAGAAALAFSILRAPNRYAGQVERRLRVAGPWIARHTGARLVVLGHSHRVDDAPGYLNVGSFGYPGEGGRPFAVITRDGTARLRYWRDG
jgi:predicted phosphodiesterase